MKCTRLLDNSCYVRYDLDMKNKYNIGKDNPNYGKHPSKETLGKMRATKLAEKNPHWCGDKIGYGGLHDWIKRRKTKPTLCERCGTRPAFDLANINHKYTRNLEDWQWLCRHCHMVEDGRINNLRQFNGRR